MARLQQLGPLDPIFDNQTQYGSIAVGNTPPTSLLTVTINKASGQADPAFGGDVLFDAVFSEPVTGFATGDVFLSGGALPTTGVVVNSGDDINYTVTVSGMTSNGDVIASVPAAVCTAISSGLPNSASTSTDNIVQYYWPRVGGFAYGPSSGVSRPATPAYPGTIANGDIAVIYATRANSTHAWVTPSGYNIVRQGDQGACYSRVCNGTETGTTVSVGVSGSSNMTAIILIVSGAGVTSATANTSATAAAVSAPTVITYPAITPSVNPTYVIYSGHAGQAPIPIVTPTNPGGSNPSPALLGVSAHPSVGGWPVLALWGGVCTSTSSLGARTTPDTGWGPNFYNGMSVAFVI